MAASYIAPLRLRNVDNFCTLCDRLVHRGPGQSGIGCFYGHAGVGKTQSAIYAANLFEAVHVEIGPYFGPKDLLENVLSQLGGTPTRKSQSIAKWAEDVVRVLMMQPDQPVLLDDAQYITKPRIIDLVKELHDKSGAPFILIGEEMLPSDLSRFERIHSRIASWVRAEPSDLDDARVLAGKHCPDLDISDEVLRNIVTRTKGSIRRIVKNLHDIQEVSGHHGATTVTPDLFTVDMIDQGTAPVPRRMA